MYSANSDAASETSSVTSDTPSEAASEGQEEGFGDALKQRAGIEEVIFGGLQLFNRYLWSSARYASVKAFLDWAQLAVLVLHPHNGWDIDHLNWFYKWFDRLLLSNVAIEQEFNGFLSIFYLFTLLNMTTLSLLIYACWCSKVNKVKWKWPLKFLANFMCVLHSVLYVSGITLLAHTFDCFPITKTYTYLDSYPEEKCLAMPGMMHLAWGLVNAVVYIILQFYWSVSSAELNPLSQHWLGLAHPVVEIRDFIIKTCLILCHVLMSPWEKPRAILLAIFGWVLLWQIMRWAPYYYDAANKVKAGAYCSIFLGYLIYAVRVLGFPEKITGSSIAVQGCCVPAFIVGWGLMSYRLRWGRHQFLRLEDYSHINHKRWIDDWEVEIFSRVCRQKDEEGDFVEENTKEADEILKTSVQAFPGSALLHVAYSGFLTHVLRAKSQLAQTQNDRARKLKPSVGIRYQIFSRAKKFKDEEASSSNNESAMDLVSYVEFQKNHRLLVHVHRDALAANRAFWRLMMRKDVTFQKMSSALKRMDASEVRALTTYGIVMERYPKSVKLMRSYGKFLEEVRNDPWTGGKYLAEADKVEESQAEAVRDAMFSKGKAAEDGEQPTVETTQVDDQTDAVCVINGSGIIQFTNKLLNRMFGYRKEELAGKNVSCLMPSPFSQNHNTYLRSYATTGKAKILDRVQYSLVALHKNRYVFPIDLIVTKVEHGGKDAFMGVIKKLEEDTTMALLYVTWGGTIMCGNNVFTDMLGYAPMELVGKPAHVVSKEEEVSAMLEFATDEANAEGLDEHEFHLDVVHKYGMRFQVLVSVTMGGTKDQRILVLKLRPVEVNTAYCVADKTGRFHFYNRVFAEMLGYRAGTLDTQATLSTVMPPTHISFHAKWLSAEDGGGSGGGCLAGQNVEFLSRGGDLVPASIEVASSQDPQTYLTLFCARIRRIKPDQLLSSAAVELTLTPHGAIEAVEGSAWTVFGYNGGDLVDEPVSTLVDVVDTRINLITQAREQGPIDPDLRLQRVLNGMLEQTRKGVVPCWRASVRPNATSSPVSARLSLWSDPSMEGGLMAQVLRADRLEGFLEVDERLKVIRTSGHLELILGYPSRVLGRITIMQLLPGAADSGDIQDLMGSGSGGGGGTKKASVGNKRQVNARHADGTLMTVTIETAAISKDEDAHYMVRISSVAGPAEGEIDGIGGAFSSFLLDAGGFDDGPSSEDNSDANSDADTLSDVDEYYMSGLGAKIAPSGGIGGGKVAPSPQVGLGLLPGGKPAPGGSHEADDGKGGAADSKAGALALATAPGGVESAADGAHESESESDAESEEDIDSAALAAQKQVKTQEFQKATAYKKLTRALASHRARRLVSRLKVTTQAIIVIIVVMHIIVTFVVNEVSVKYNTYVTKVDSGGHILELAQYTAVHARSLDEIRRGRVPAEDADLLEEKIDDMRVRLNEFQRIHWGLYLGFYKLEAPDPETLHLMQDPNLRVKVTRDVRDVDLQEYEDRMGLFDLGNRYSHAGFEVALHSSDGEGFRYWRFMIDNGPWVLADAYLRNLVSTSDSADGHVSTMVQVILLSTAAEGLVMLMLAAYVFYLIYVVSRERTSMLSVFLVVPRPTVRQLATISVSLDEDSDEDGEEEDEWSNQQDMDEDEVAQTAGKKKKKKGKAAAAVKVKYNFKSARRLRHSSRDAFRLSLPLLGVAVVVVAFFMGSYLLTEDSRSPLHDAAAAQKVVYYATRVRYFAQEVISAETADVVRTNQGHLTTSVQDLLALHEALLFGDGDSLKGSLYRSPSHSKLFFDGPRCLRFDRALCMVEGEDAYYEETNYGLDSLIYTYIGHAEAIAKETVFEDLTWENPHFDFIWQVGHADLFDGLKQSARLYGDMAREVVTSTKIILSCLVIIILGTLSVYYYRIFKPFAAGAAAEARRVANLLSQLPDEMGVELLEEHGKHHAAAGHGQGMGGEDHGAPGGAQGSGAGGFMGNFGGGASRGPGGARGGGKPRF